MIHNSSVIEKKAKMNMEKLIKKEDPNQKIYIPQQTGYIMNINRELYIKQVPVKTKISFPSANFTA